MLFSRWEFGFSLGTQSAADVAIESPTEGAPEDSKAEIPQRFEQRAHVATEDEFHFATASVGLESEVQTGGADKAKVEDKGTVEVVHVSDALRFHGGDDRRKVEPRAVVGVEHTGPEIGGFIRLRRNEFHKVQGWLAFGERLRAVEKIPNLFQGMAGSEDGAELVGGESPWCRGMGSLRGHGINPGWD